MVLYISSTLSVSRKEKLDCYEMAKYLSKAGIMTSITANISTQPELENGSRLVQSITSKEDIANIWTLVQKKYKFTCAHLNIPNKFDGCVLDFLSPNKCNIEDESSKSSLE